MQETDARKNHRFYATCHGPCQCVTCRDLEGEASKLAWGEREASSWGCWAKLRAAESSELGEIRQWEDSRLAWWFYTYSHACYIYTQYIHTYIYFLKYISSGIQTKKNKSGGETNYISLNERHCVALWHGTFLKDFHELCLICWLENYLPKMLTPLYIERVFPQNVYSYFE